MIGNLQGFVLSVADNHAIIDVNGVGYFVFASKNTLEQLTMAGENNKKISLIIETNVREDHIHLFAFLTEVERDVFRLLTSVQGVGAKAGLAIMSINSANEILNFIAIGDITSLTKAQGIGKKIAERITTELKRKTIITSSFVQKFKIPTNITVNDIPQTSFVEKIENIANIEEFSEVSSEQSESNFIDLQNDAVSALVNLGYNRIDAFSAVAKAGQIEDNRSSIDMLIKEALREL